MNILITGADGFVGTNLLKYLEYNVNTIVALVYNNSEYLNIIKSSNSNIIVKKYDANTEFNFLLLLTKYKIDTVIHLAAITNLNNQTDIYNKFINVNVFSSIRLIQDSIKYGVTKFIFISSAGIYLNQKPEYKNSEVDEINTKEIYFFCKSIVESICNRMNGNCKTVFIILRVGTLFGEYEFKSDFRYKTSLIRKIIKLLLQNETIKVYGSDVCRDFFHVENLANIVNKLINTSNLKYPIYNVGINQTYSIKRILEYFSLLYEKCVWVEADESESDIVLYSKDNRSALNTNRILELDNSYPKISLNDGLLKTHNWYKNIMRNNKDGI